MHILRENPREWSIIFDALIMPAEEKEFRSNCTVGAVIDAATPQSEHPMYLRQLNLLFCLCDLSIRLLISIFHLIGCIRLGIVFECGAWEHSTVSCSAALRLLRQLMHSETCADAHLYQSVLSGLDPEKVGRRHQAQYRHKTSARD